MPLLQRIWPHLALLLAMCFWSTSYLAMRIALTALVRDDAGSIVASGETYIDMIPEGSTASFEIPLFTPAASGTLEVHARTW